MIMFSGRRSSEIAPEITILLGVILFVGSHDYKVSNEMIKHLP